jgi:hypothetical protein
MEEIYQNFKEHVESNLLLVCLSSEWKNGQKLNQDGKSAQNKGKEGTWILANSGSIKDQENPMQDIVNQSLEV